VYVCRSVWNAADKTVFGALLLFRWWLFPQAELMYIAVALKLNCGGGQIKVATAQEMGPVDEG
jgi:hypothetical protein